ncbi:MAG TPA: NYN domain-containing protein, partial [Candidatus Limnocylindrales bacterium]|nr:NYN domain-containing protein [Candidatus Limnocylindrales bacterium]
MSKNVAVFVDVANIFYAAKAAGVDIDYVTLLKASSAGRDLVRAYAYTGLDPENENQRNFHDFLRRHGYKVVSKDIRKYGDGKVKANLDIELVVDMMKTARNLDIAIVVSGDGDFAPAIRAVQEMGVRVEVVSFRGNTSSDLIDVADIFTDITQIAKVEKGSARSGRRVADDDEDLSMTEVPDKMTEGTGDGRRRGRGTRTRSGEAAVGRSSTSRATTSRARTSTARAAAKDAVVADGTLVALPGEKLSRAGRAAAAASEAEDAVQPDLEPDEGLAVDGEIDAEGAEGAEGADVVGAEGDAPHRRRRRRGGRGRGRGRGRELEAPAEGVGPVGDAEDFEEPEPLPAPRRQAFSFGSVWDSQLGKAPAAASGGSGLGPIEEDEDLEEPAIPEYLLAERRNRDGARRGGRGGGLPPRAEPGEEVVPRGRRLVDRLVASIPVVADRR